jgi:hypothetical protein
MIISLFNLKIKNYYSNYEAKMTTQVIFLRFIAGIVCTTQRGNRKKYAKYLTTFPAQQKDPDN